MYSLLPKGTLSCAKVECALFALLLCALVLSGCGGTAVMTSNQGAANPVGGPALQGRVHGGQQPISGAHVYLYAASTAGYNAQSVSLLKNASGTTKDSSGNYYVTTASDGSFSITSDYSCPSDTAQVYIYSTGGDSGSGTNSAIGLLAGLGTCAVPVTNSLIYVDEVSTIATAYAIAGYAMDATDVSSSGSTLAVTGITNAFAAVRNLETLQTGLALATTPAGNGTVPQSEINTLANILAACINSSGAGSAPCTTLLGTALANGTSGMAPTDTANAAINIAHNPWANVGTLFGLQTGSPPFQPMLSPPAPNDFTIAIGYTGGGLGPGTGGVAVDASGNVWVNQSTGSGSGVIIKLSPTGEILSGASGYTAGGQIVDPYDVEIDSSGNIWESDVSTIVEMNSTGTAISTSPGYGVGAENVPYNIAFDAQGHLWVTDFDDDVLIELSSTGGLLSGTGFSGGGLNGPTGIAVDATGNLWISNDGGTTMSEFNESGVANMSSPFSGNLDRPAGISVDPSGNVWVASFGNSNLVEFNSSGSVLSTASTSDGVNYPAGPVPDSAGNIFLSNLGGNSISEFSSNGKAITNTTGYQGSGLDEPDGIVIDGSGNLWAANTASSTSNVVEFVGIASPVVTPLVANLLNPYGQHTANKP